jgi:hypothetical protein
VAGSLAVGEDLVAGAIFVAITSNTTGISSAGQRFDGTGESIIVNLVTIDMAFLVATCLFLTNGDHVIVRS